MRLYNEILKKFDGGEAGELFAGTRYTVLPGRGGYFQGGSTARKTGFFFPVTKKGGKEGHEKRAS